MHFLRGRMARVRLSSLALLVMLSLTGLAAGQDWARKMFETTSHDFGNVARGSKVDYDFKFHNPYKEDAHVMDVRSSCGCTTPRVLKDSMKTYEESAIVASFNTRSFLGQRSATITVVFDKPFYAEVQLQVQGYIRRDIVIHPGDVDLGTVDQGTPVEKAHLDQLRRPRRLANPGREIGQPLPRATFDRDEARIGPGVL